MQYFYDLYQFHLSHPYPGFPIRRPYLHAARFDPSQLHYPGQSRRNLYTLTYTGQELARDLQR